MHIIKCTMLCVPHWFLIEATSTRVRYGVLFESVSTIRYIKMEASQYKISVRTNTMIRLIRCNSYATPLCGAVSQSHRVVSCAVAMVTRRADIAVTPGPDPQDGPGLTGQECLSRAEKSAVKKIISLAE